MQQALSSQKFFKRAYSKAERITKLHPEYVTMFAKKETLPESMLRGLAADALRTGPRRSTALRPAGSCHGDDS